MRNIVAATPGCERMPAPISETLPSPSFTSTSYAPSSVWVDSIARRVAGTSSAGTENDISALPWTMFWMIVSTFTWRRRDARRRSSPRLRGGRGSPSA